MKEIAQDIDRWLDAGQRVALARVVNLEGSGPRDPGAAMAVNEAGQVTGSVSGGCVEGAVVTEALDVLETNSPPRVVTFGYSDDEAFAVGLTCGGTIHLLIEPLTWDAGVQWSSVRDLLTADQPLALASVMEGPNPGARILVRPDGTAEGTLGDPDLDRVVTRDAAAELAAGRTIVRHYGACGQANEQTVAVFIESFARPPRMIIFGAVDFTASLARAAKLLGYRVIVCDAREVFATKARFPMADDVEVDWPDRILARLGPELGPEDAVCVLTHDPKFDVPAIVGALATDVGYLGVMGSRRTHEKRMERLAEEGVTEPDQLARIMAPIGLDIGARSPEETAVAVCAEIIALRTGHPALSLRDSDGPIHRDTITQEALDEVAPAPEGTPMELSNEFTVSAPIDEAFAVLTDIEKIAPCMPGAQLTEVEGDEYRGTVKVKVGPITASFKGTTSLVERDEAAHRAVLKAQGRDTGGKGNANATITAQLEPAGDGTHVSIATDLNITGRVAQFGRGALADVSQKLIGQFAERLEADVLSGNGGTPAAEPADEPGEAVSPAVAAAAPAEEPKPAPDAPAVRRIEGPDAAPVDLLDTAGAPMAKRLVPVFVVALLAFVLLRRRRKRRRSASD